MNDVPTKYPRPLTAMCHEPCAVPRPPSFARACAAARLRPVAAADPDPMRDDFDALMGICYPELRRIAQDLMSRERRNHTLQATALVHEAWMRLQRSAGIRFNDAQHCLRLLSRAMRRLLCEHAKRRNAIKRGEGKEPLPLDLVDAPVLHQFGGWEQLERLDEALTELEAERALHVRVVEAKVFAELTDEEASRMLGIGVTTYKKHWTFARAWLLAWLNERGAQ